MAEGGYDIDFDSTTIEGRENINTTIDDELTSLLPRTGESNSSFWSRIKPRLQRFGTGYTYAREYFMDLLKTRDPNVYTRFQNEEIEMDNIGEQRIRVKYPNVDKDLINLSTDNGKKMISFWSARRGSWTIAERLYNEDNTVRRSVDKKLKSGKYNNASNQISELEQVIDDAYDNIQQRDEQIQRNNEERPSFSTDRQSQIDNENERLEQQNEQDRESIDETIDIINNLQERMSLKDRVKYILKKYGLTVTGIALSVGVIIGVIINSLKNGLTSVAKSTSNALKQLGTKLGQILPGMVGAIASFIFRTAGQVLGFVANNLWLLIVAVVMYVIDRYKNKK